LFERWRFVGGGDGFVGACMHGNVEVRDGLLAQRDGHGLVGQGMGWYGRKRAFELDVTRI
jgi:hypothetical protein